MKTSVQLTILNLISNSLFKTSREISAGSNTGKNADSYTFWKEVLEECKNQAIAPTVSETLPFMQKAVVDENLQEIRGEWDKSVLSYYARNMGIGYAHEELCRVLEKNEIPYVILKGIASADYYPDPKVRTLGDVDFFVKKSDVERTMNVLDRAGYICEAPLKTQHHHVSYKKDEIHLELHFNLNGVPEGEAGDRISQYTNDIIETASPDEKAGIMVPDEFHHGLVILLHNSHHMMNTGMGLRHLCDWAVFVDHIGDKFPEIFENNLKQVGLWEYANVLTAVCSEKIGLPRQAWCKTYDMSLIDEFIDDIFRFGNFGSKKAGNASYMFTQNTNGRIKNTGLAGRFIQTANQATRAYWPIVKKVVILYPVGWVFFTIRRFYLMAIGRRPKIKVTKTISSAKRRNKLYREFKLFCIE